jgi:hypothetical protein
MATGTQQKITIKNTKLGQYGWIIWAEQKVNPNDPKDWCLFPSKDCEQPAGFDWANVQPGDTVLLVWNRYDKTGQTRYYINGVIQHNPRGAATTATATADSTLSAASSTPTSSAYEDREAAKNRQIFVQGISQAILSNPNCTMFESERDVSNLLMMVDNTYDKFINKWPAEEYRPGGAPAYVTEDVVADDKIPF